MDKGLRPIVKLSEVYTLPVYFLSDAIRYATVIVTVSKKFLSFFEAYISSLLLLLALVITFFNKLTNINTKQEHFKVKNKKHLLEFVLNFLQNKQ